MTGFLKLERHLSTKLSQNQQLCFAGNTTLGQRTQFANNQHADFTSWPVSNDPLLELLDRQAA